MSTVKMFTFDNVEQNDSVVVIGGGPSLTKNIDTVIRYIENNKSTVLVANYHHPKIKADYTYFTDNSVYNSNIKTIKCPNIVLAYRLLHGRKRLRVKRLENKNYFQLGVGKGKQKGNIYNQKRLEIKRGVVKQQSMGMSGFSCVFMSVFFRPKRVLLVGFDGPADDFKTKKVFDGSTRKYPRPYTIPVKKRYFINTLLPYLRRKDIQLECFKTDALWGANKKKLKIVTIGK